MPYPTAVAWDLATKDYLLDADGSHTEVHPIDAEVTIRLGVRRGTIAGDTTIGHTLDQVRMGQSDAAMGEEILRRQVESLGRLVTDGLVDSVRVEFEATSAGGLWVRTHWRNTQTGGVGKVTR
jgi:hypothetical protein